MFGLRCDMEMEVEMEVEVEMGMGWECHSGMSD
jgi:hypothetical protein